MKKWTGSDEDFAQLHHCHLILMKEIHRVCEKHNIPYFLSDGTLIGAVRHKGFIPWDDDVDLGMLRKDYERFLSICDSGLDKRFVRLTEKNCGFLPYVHMTIVLPDTKLKMRIPWMSMIGVDILPYDNVPDSKVLRCVHRYLSLLFQYSLSYKIRPAHFDSGFRSRCIQLFVSIISHLFSKRALIAISEKMQRLFENIDTGSVTKNIGTGSYYGSTTNIKNVQQRILAPFENTMFYIPAGYDEILTNLYGDYMTPPPEHVNLESIPVSRRSYVSRNAHSIEAFDPGPYVLETQK